jgi:hypothetical protein
MQTGFKSPCPCWCVFEFQSRDFEIFYVTKLFENWHEQAIGPLSLHVQANFILK